jgi:hypothetical protein
MCCAGESEGLECRNHGLRGASSVNADNNMIFMFIFSSLRTLQVLSVSLRIRRPLLAAVHWAPVPPQLPLSVESAQLALKLVSLPLAPTSVLVLLPLTLVSPPLLQQLVCLLSRRTLVSLPSRRKLVSLPSRHKLVSLPSRRKLVSLVPLPLVMSRVPLPLALNLVLVSCPRRVWERRPLLVVACSVLNADGHKWRVAGVARNCG